MLKARVTYFMKRSHPDPKEMFVRPPKSYKKLNIESTCSLLVQTTLVCPSIDYYTNLLLASLQSIDSRTQLLL